MGRKIFGIKVESRKSYITNQADRKLNYGHLIVFYYFNFHDKIVSIIATMEKLL